MDIYASGLASAEDIGDGQWRFVFYVNQRSLYGGEEERVVVARLVMPAAAAVVGSFTALNAMNGVPRECQCLRRCAH